MKRHLTFVLLLLLVILQTQAQQNVGIGTTAPLSKLHVRTGTDSLMLLENTHALGAGIANSIHFKTASVYTGAVKTIGEGTAAARMGFYTGTQASATNLQERVSILNNGFVGIDATNPTTKFQVGDYNTNPNDTYLSIKTVGGGQYKAGVALYHYSDNYGWLLESDETANRFSIRHRNSGTFNNPVFNIDWFDRVGIGSTTPTTKLQVGDVTNAFDNYITVKTAGGNLYKSGIGLYHYSDNYGWLLESDEFSGAFSIRHRNSNAVFNNQVFTVNALDNVGIGQAGNNDTRMAIYAGNNNIGLSVAAGLFANTALSVNGKSAFSDNVGIGQGAFNDTRLVINSGNTNYFGLGINGDNAQVAALAVNGKSIFNVLNKQLVVTGTASGNPTNYTDSYPLLVEGGQQGIAVKINSNAAHEGNNYMYFQDNLYIRGSIAGQNLDELHNSFDYIWYQTMQSFDAAFILAEGIACGAQIDLGEVAVMAFEGAEFVVKWIQESVNLENNVGVVYQSNAADYAEWLEREDVNEQLEPGMIVGVNGGRVSRHTTQTKQLMVISTAPLVLGNTPPEGRSSSFEKVAFMGQVPVRVRGKADVGDYILPSGENDGVGIAVAPGKMQLEDYNKVVGVAWSSSTFGNGESLVKTAVGLNTHDLVGEIKQQKTEVQQLKETLGGLMAYLKEKDPSFKLNMPAGQTSYAGTTNPTVSDQPQPGQPKKPVPDRDLNDVYNMLRSHPEFVDAMFKRAKEICIARGIDINTESAKGLLDREAFYQRFEKALTHRAAPQKSPVPAKSEDILKQFHPVQEKN